MDKGDDSEKRQRLLRSTIGYALAALVIMWLFQEFVLGPLATRTAELGYSDFKHKLADGQVAEVVIGHDKIQGTLKGQKPVPFVAVFAPDGDPKLAEELDKASVKYGFERPASPIGGFLLGWILPLALLFYFYSLARRRLG